MPETGSSPAAAAGVKPIQRYAFIDLIRGVAIAAMVVYHAAFDLSTYQLIATDVPNDLAWTLFARLIAGTFILLVGFNMVLATRRGFHRNRYLKRLGILVAAALAVSVGTYWFDPATFVFFGILHQIALSSVLVLAFLRLPSLLIAAAAAAAIALPFYFSHEVFDHPILWWVGLSVNEPVSLDYVPLFPMFGVALAGVVAGRMFARYASDWSLSGWQPGNGFLQRTVDAGRWSLVIYLIHQPILIGIVVAAATFIPANIDTARTRFNTACVPSCQQRNSERVCTEFCTCLFEGMFDTDLYDVRSVEKMSPDQRHRWSTLLGNCGGTVAEPLEEDG